MKKYLIIILTTIISMCSFAQDVNFKKIQENALKFYKNGDILSAIKVFEENDIKTFIQSKPNDLKDTVYASILNDYAFYLSECNERYKESKDIFIRIIEINPKRIVTYLNLGDILIKEYNESKAKDLKNKAIEYYKVYYQLVNGKKIPARVIKVLFEDNKQVLKILDMIENDKKEDELDKLGKELNEKEKKDFIEKVDSEYEYMPLYYIDLDGDGVDEIVRRGTAGSLYFEHYMIFKKDEKGNYNFVQDLEGDSHEYSYFIKDKSNYYIMAIYKDYNIEHKDYKKYIRITLYKFINTEFKQINFVLVEPEKNNKITIKNKTEIGKEILSKNEYFKEMAHSLKYFVYNEKPLKTNKSYNKFVNIIIEVGEKVGAFTSMADDVEGKTKYWCSVDMDNDGVDEIVRKASDLTDVLKYSNGKYKWIDSFSLEKQYKNFEKTDLNNSIIGDYIIYFYKYKGKIYTIAMNMEELYTQYRIFLFSQTEVEEVDTIDINNDPLYTISSIK